MKKILVILCIFTLLSGNLSWVFAANSAQSTPYTKLRTVDLWTFNEYRYKLTEQFFTLRNDFEVTGAVKESTIVDIYKIAKESYNYLPDNLINKNLYKKLEIALAKSAKYTANESVYLALIDALDNYLEDVNIKSIKGSVTATPEKGNAPLSVTLRWNVRDETGTKIPSYNYVWWIDDAGKRKVIGNKPSIHYVFREEGTFSAFLDVTSSHKNSKGFTDVLPFRSRADIVVKEKIASLIIKVNSDTLRDKDELKFTPQESGYGLVFDATSSTPTGGAKFTKTEWDFGNGVERTNTGEPEIERVKYTKEWEYTVTLKLRTNEGKTVERKFTINVHDPIATIHASQEQWYLGDKFTFSAKPTGSDDNLSYDWEIIDIDFDKQIFNKSGKTFTYTFPNKGKYNVKLRVTEPSGEVDIDTTIIYINSRAPVAEFSYKIPHAHQPNTVLLDASKSYDLDGIDDGKLTYEWLINGERVELDRARFNGAVGYYTFDSIESHSVLLKVSDPEGMSSQINKKVQVKSILALDFAAYPRVTQREIPINFQADSPEATVFAWNFWDGNIKSGRNSNITHKYKESGIYTVKLEVSDSDDKTNIYTKKVYIWDSNRPLAHINVLNTQNNEVETQAGACYGENAYVVDRAWSVNFSAQESIDVTGKNSGLTYSWKLGQNKYFSNVTFAQKFDELGCFPIQLTVKSKAKGKTDKIKTWVKVWNLKPTLSSVDVQVVDGSADPVVVKVSALGATDLDGVIQSYLWYYYTDIDPEPQDFRATKQANTTFVLPKVTGNYYFVVLMKDNNEQRVSSEDITGSKYFITLTGDNINVPLVNLWVNDSSISVGQEVVFTAEVENILGYNLSKKAEYSWDLDWDGFYEQKTNAPSLAYTYERSWEFYAKVKAKYKWYSNTKSITMNVSNLLKPDMEYVSIWNKFIFFNTSIWRADSVKWDLADGTKVSDSQAFLHTFDWNKGSYDISLELKEGIKVAEKEFNVKKNVKNMIAARKQGLVIFSNKIITDNVINIEDNKDKVFLYLGESKGKIENQLTDFSIDTNTEYDTNLNGWKDDDKDISLSYGKNDSIVEIKLNDTKNQSIKVVAYDIEGNELYNQELLIVKDYIEDEEIDINSIEFKGITQSEYETIEELKSEIKKLPKEYRLKSLMYVQKLQEEWFDASEKTKVIVEFEGYISNVDSVNAINIYGLLEALLLEWEDDKSEKNLMYVALKNLTPTNIECGLSTDVKDGKCYNAIIERLDIIKVNNDIEENKALAKEILEAIAVYPDMTNTDKQNFKAILSSFVYGWVDNIPEPVKQDVIKDDIDESSNNNSLETNAFIGVIKTILFIFAIIIWIFIWAFIIFFLFYKISNKDDNVGFQDFIIEKTSGKKKKIVVQKDETEDILKELDADLGKTETKPEDKIWKDTKNTPSWANDPLKSIGEKTQPKDIKTSKEEVPDWLKGNFTEDGVTTWENKKEDKKVQTTKSNPIVEKPIEKKNEVKNNFSKTENKNTQTKLDEWVPDWLKGSFVEETKNKDATEVVTEEKNKDVKQEKTKKDNFQKLDGKVNNQKQEKVTDNKDGDIPDWLKWAIDTDTTPKSNGKKEDTSKQSWDQKNNIWWVDKDLPKMDTKEDLDKLTEVKSEDKQKKSDWDIPDWLKGSLSEKTEEKKSEVKSEDKQKKSDWDIPDWLKGSLSEETEEKIPESKKEQNQGKTTSKESEPKKIEEKETNKKVENKATIQQDKEQNTEKSKDKIIVEPLVETENSVGEKKEVKTIEKKSTSTKKPASKSVKKSTAKKTSSKEETVEKQDTKVEDKKPKEVVKETKTTTKQKVTTQETESKKIEDELWDDGMKIPDWLKTDDDK